MFGTNFERLLAEKFGWVRDMPQITS